jgi:minor extracellular serine protease Vpr
MVKSRRISVVVAALSIGFGVSFSQLSRSLIQQKLHPTFQSVIASDATNLLSKFAGGPVNPAVTLTEGKVLFDAIVTTTNQDALKAAGIKINSAFEKYATAQLTRDDLVSLVQRTDVQYIDPGSINYPTLDLSRPETGAGLLHAGFVNKTPYKGKGVIVVIYDTGIDWKHLDFRDPVDTTKSRILFVWDQTLTPTTGENSPSGMTYGVEYTKTQIENEIDGSPTGFVREKDINGHGTHVTGIAAGNGNSYFNKYVGMAPEADIIVVKGGDQSFGESKMIDGLTYASYKASQLGKPVVMNWSIGGQAGPHNGNRAYEVAVNSFVSNPGKVVCISAGNDGAKNIHTSGSVAPVATTTISIDVPTYTATAGTDNDTFQLDVWFSSPLGVTARATSPSGVTLDVSANNSGTASSATDGTIDLYNFPSTLTDNSTLVQLYVHDKTANTPKSGTWTLSFLNANTAVGFDAWLSASTVGSQSASIVGGNTSKTVSMPGTAEGAITVASYITKNGWPALNGGNYVYTGTVTVGTRSAFSAIGPTGDGRQKPDIAAPGQGIASSLSTMCPVDSIYDQAGFRDQLMQGTSQASPHVAGAAALLLQISPSLTAVQIKSLLTSTATVDAATGSVPNMLYGYGKMDVLKAAAKAFNPLSSVQRQTYAYDVDGTNGIYLITGSAKYAVRFSPTSTGQLAAMQLNITTQSNRPIQGAGPLVCEVWSNVSGSLGGIPGTRLGNPVLQPFERLSTGTNNYIDMTAAGVTVTAGQEYHLVVTISNVKDTIKLRSDTPTSATQTNRSSSYDGFVWKNLLESAPSTAANLRMRAIVVSSSGLVSVENTGSVPKEFQLAQNFPNPFNPSTTIRYSVPVQSQIRLRVFDLIGREVASLVDQQQGVGSYSVNWSGADNLGVPLSSGVYFYRLESAGQQLTRKMILLK